jgi:hypothetical protein
MLTEEQLRILRESKTAVTVVGPDDQPVASMRLLTPEDVELIALAKTRQHDPDEPCVPAERVHSFLLKLHEIEAREGIDADKVQEVLRRVKAGEPL